MKCQKPNCDHESRVTITSKRGHKLHLCAEHYFALTTPKPAPAKDDAKPASAWMSVGEA